MVQMISVVIPTHNRAMLLRRAVDSVLSQSISDLELVVVSDGSTDDTCQVMQNYIEKDARVTFIHYSNALGANHARNTGIKACMGQYIAFLDDDDEWYPTKLEKQIAIFQQNESIGLVYAGVNIVQQDKGTHYFTIPKDKGNLSKEILFRNCITTTSSVVVKKRILDEVGGFDENLPANQDYDLWIRCLQITEVGYVSEPLLNYYVSTNANQISSHTEKYVIAAEIIDSKYKDLLAFLTKEETSRREAIKYSDLAKTALKNNSKEECRVFCVKSYNNKPSLLTIGLYIASYFSYSFVIRVMQFVRR